MVCENCGSEHKGEFSFVCYHCDMILCKRCRVPELHNCPSVKYTVTKGYVKHDLNDFAMKKEM